MNRYERLGMEKQIERAIRNYQEQVVHLSLATVSDNKPWICELHFAYDENLNLYFRSLPSRRHSVDIANNPYVAGNIIKQHTVDEEPSGVYFDGKAKMLDTNESKEHAHKYIKDRLKVADEALEEAEKEDGHQDYKIEVDNWYFFGKTKKLPFKMHKLPWGN